MNSLGDILGEICKTILPIEEEVFYGNKKSQISICTLSNINLLKEISNSPLMDNVAIVGRLLSENKGIDSLVRFVISHENIKSIILCGDEVSGHKAGHSLISLHKNGIDYNNRIIGSVSPEPILQLKQKEVKRFQNQVKIIDKIGLTNLHEINQIVNSITS